MSVNSISLYVFSIRAGPEGALGARGTVWDQKDSVSTFLELIV